MEFFGIGMPELMLVLIIAIVIFGPDKIPAMVGQVTKAIRDFRRYTSELTKEFNEATGGLRDEFATITNDLKSELAQTQADLQSQLDLTDVLRTDNAAVPAALTAATAAEPAIAEPAVTATAPSAAAEPEPAVTATAPATDALTAASGTNGHNGHADGALALTVPLATKADPLADLTVLLLEDAAQSASPALAAVGAETAASAVSVSENNREPAAAARDAGAPAAMPGTNGAKPRVGGSVAGSKYARRRKGEHLNE